jgi:hypothetical protein
VILTHESLKAGESIRGAFNGYQVRLLGDNMKFRGWRQRLIGKYVPDDVYQKFLSAKDSHLKNKQVYQRYLLDKQGLSFDDVSTDFRNIASTF